MARLGTPLQVLELGCGPGRDSRALAAAGHSVRAVDHSRVAIERARAVPGNPPSLRFELRDAESAAREVPDASIDVVYAHGLYMMFSGAEMERLLVQVRRALRPGGLHLFAVRSVSDPLAGQGEEIDRDVFVGGPHVTPVRYYRAETVDAMAEQGFHLLDAEYRPELHLYFVCHRRP
jgi:SAM-dependent methyltransferase